MSIPRLLLAVVVAASVILSAPFIRDIRDWILKLFPGQFTAIVAGAVGVTILGAVIIALARIRERRLARYGAIAGALALGTTYAWWNAQGNPQVDAVERFHFVEYGLVTLLFYRAFHPLGDASPLVMPVLAGLLVGTLEEWLQWFIPGRVGDMRDVFLNGAAILSGMLFSIGLDPPRLSVTFRPGSVRRIAMLAGLVTVVFALFVHTVHLGHEIAEPEGVRFRSRYDAAELAAIGGDRAAVWKTSPPLQRPKSLSREDQYQSEAHLHVQQRNRLWADDIRGSWLENAILEKFYAPVLDAPSFLSPTGHRWPDAQRSDAERRAGAAGPTYQSLADVAEGRHFLRIWPKPWFWTSVALVLAAIAGLAVILERRSAERAVAEVVVQPRSI